MTLRSTPTPLPLWLTMMSVWLTSWSQPMQQTLSCRMSSRRQHWILERTLTRKHTSVDFFGAQKVVICNCMCRAIVTWDRPLSGSFTSPSMQVTRVTRELWRRLGEDFGGKECSQMSRASVKDAIYAKCQMLQRINRMARWILWAYQSVVGKQWPWTL